MKDKIKIGVGFATGRKHFQNILKSYILNFMESGLVENEKIELNLFVAYDLKYRGTKKADYTAIPSSISAMIENTYFIGPLEVASAKFHARKGNNAGERGAALLFGKGYAAQRNVILYYAIKNNIDYLLFLDDDEYPLAVTRNHDVTIWSGQHVLKTHLKNIKNADITCGYHCGYISPIPVIDFSETLPEASFQLFMECLSNDILNWENIKKVMGQGGVTYADTGILIANRVVEAEEINHTKFISGSNLCINLTDPQRVYPFYNPPGARGEDTFLSTCLQERTVLRIPCYTFHDGFSVYKHILSGVLPTSLKAVGYDTENIVKRFYTACIGWVRYKPLLLYITDRPHYQEKIEAMTENLKLVLPEVCRYFDNNAFMNILTELKKYTAAVGEHYRDFEETKAVWSDLMKLF